MYVDSNTLRMVKPFHAQRLVRDQALSPVCPKDDKKYPYVKGDGSTFFVWTGSCHMVSQFRAR